MFKKYAPLENSYQRTVLEQMKIKGYWKEEFAVQERIQDADLGTMHVYGMNIVADVLKPVIQCCDAH